MNSLFLRVINPKEKNLTRCGCTDRFQLREPPGGAVETAGLERLPPGSPWLRTPSGELAGATSGPALLLPAGELSVWELSPVDQKGCRRAARPLRPCAVLVAVPACLLYH